MINVIDRYDRLCQNLGATRVVLTQDVSSDYYTSTNSTKQYLEYLDEWCTPPDIIQLVLQVLNEIDLDPCAEGNNHIPARSHFTKIDDGLQHEWHGRLFINPPSSHPDKWIAKLTAEITSGRVSEAIALLPAATDTDWLNSVLKTQPVCFYKERIHFLDTTSTPNLPYSQSHCLVYWGKNQYRFKQVFDPYGIVYLPIWKSDEVLPDNSTSSTKRRSRGKGTGRIHWRTVTKRNGKQYEQAWYDWELNTGEKTLKKSTYIPKHLFKIILELEISKAPVSEILGMLGVSI